MNGLQDLGVTHRNAGLAGPPKNMQEVPNNHWLEGKIETNKSLKLKYKKNSLLKCYCGPTPGTILPRSEF